MALQNESLKVYNTRLFVNIKYNAAKSVDLPTKQT